MVTLLSACGAAHAQFAADFEAPAYTGSSTGTPLTNGFGGGGQQGWYNPVSGSADGSVYTYIGHPFLFPVNPQGGGQFEVGVFGGGAAFARAQHAVDFSAGGMWEASWDCTGYWAGTALPAGDNLGSFSLQSSANTRYFQQLMSWGPTINGSAVTPVTNHSTTGEFFHIAWGFFTSPTQAAAAPTFAVAGPAWTDLPVNNWYHIRVKWDFATARMLEVSIRNITAGGPTVTNDLSANNWFLFGGENSVAPLPTDVRLFTGTGGGATAAPGNITAWDSLIVRPFVGTCYANCDNSTQAPVLNVADFGCFLTRYAAGEAYANCDDSTQPPVLNVADFGCFLTKYAAGCP